MALLNSWLKVDWSKSQITIANIPIDLHNVYKYIFKFILVIIIFTVMCLIIKIGNKLIDKIMNRQAESNMRFSMDKKKAITLNAVLKSILKYSVYFIGVLSIMSMFFSGISVTFAGIGGAALGFGAKDLISDLINGVFILFEDQFGVGDYVTLGNYNGIVESIGIRSTVLKDFSGDVHSIPNGSIITVTNHSKNNMRVMIDIDIAYEESIDEATEVIDKLCEDFSKFNDDITDVPRVIGVQALKDSSVTLRILGASKPMKQWSIERSLRKLIKLTLDEKGIEIPYPKTELINKENG